MPSTHAGIRLPSRYRVDRHVANGGMASVWAAEDCVLGRIVAVKVLAAHIAEDPGSRTRFEREARTAARVSDHPNVVTIYDVGEHEGVPFIVMELFTGGSVADRLREGARLPRSQVLDWLTQAAAALDYAHAEGIVHRDVKPANLLLDDRSRLAVGDFGIARLGDESALTQAGMVLGTAAYLSPEQALGHPATAASDRYALGVVAFELMTGRRPFGGEHLAAQARAHVEADPPGSGLGPEVDDVLHRALAKDPEGRHLTAGRFVDELRAAARRAGATGPTRVATAPPPAPTPTPPPVAPAPTRRSVPVAAPAAAAAADPPYARRRAGRGRAWLLAALAGLVLLLGLGALLVGGLGGGDDEPAAERPASTQAEPPAASTPETAPEPEPAPAPAATQEAAPEPEAAPPAEEEDDGSEPGPPANAESPEQLNDQGFAALNAGDTGRAIELLEQADKGFERQGDGASSVAWGFALFNLGQAYERAGQPKDAVKAYERRLEVSPTNQRSVVEAALARAEAASKGGN